VDDQHGDEAQEPVEADLVEAYQRVLRKARTKPNRKPVEADVVEAFQRVLQSFRHKNTEHKQNITHIPFESGCMESQLLESGVVCPAQIQEQRHIPSLPDHQSRSPFLAAFPVGCKAACGMLREADCKQVRITSCETKLDAGWPVRALCPLLPVLPALTHLPANLHCIISIYIKA
jgi:hypothetical protein